MQKRTPWGRMRIKARLGKRNWLKLLMIEKAFYPFGHVCFTTACVYNVIFCAIWYHLYN